MTTDAPSRDAYEVYAKSIECLVSGTEPLMVRIEDAFRAGYAAGRAAADELGVDVVPAAG